MVFQHLFIRTLTVSVRIVIEKSAGNILIAVLLQHQYCELCCLRMQAFSALCDCLSGFFFCGTETSEHDSLVGYMVSVQQICEQGCCNKNKLL